MMKENFETFCIAKTWKRIVARLIDMTIISFIPIIVTIIWFYSDRSTVQVWWTIILVIFLNYCLLFIYFVILPWYWNGKTVAKQFLRIRLISENQGKYLRFCLLFKRELFLTFIPFTLVSLMIILTGIVQPNITHDNNNQTNIWWITILTKVIASFIFVWYLGIMIVEKIDQNHQLFYDHQNNSYVVEKHPIRKQDLHHVQKTSPIVHVHLSSNLPGIISNQDLDDIKNLS